MKRKVTAVWQDFMGKEHETKEAAEQAENDYLRRNDIPTFVDNYASEHDYKDRMKTIIQDVLVVWCLHNRPEVKDAEKAA